MSGRSGRCFLTEVYCLLTKTMRNTPSVISLRYRQSDAWIPKKHYVSVKQKHSILIFVYGSLMSGQKNHQLLSGARFLGAAISQPHYTLFHAGPWPAAVDGGTSAIHGELYRISTPLCISLDNFEGHPTLFRRRGITLEDGNQADAWLLAIDPDSSWPIINSGRWASENVANQNPEHA